jgi:hypothetical protein
LCNKVKGKLGDTNDKGDRVDNGDQVENIDRDCIIPIDPILDSQRQENSDILEEESSIDSEGRPKKTLTLRDFKKHGEYLDPWTAKDKIKICVPSFFVGFIVLFFIILPLIYSYWDQEPPNYPGSTLVTKGE